MSSRRLKAIRSCAVCAVQFRPFRRTQLTCSGTCGAIRRAKIHPHTITMLAANRAKRVEFLANLVNELEGLTKLQCYQKGNIRGYRTGYQRASRENRWSAA